MKRVFALMIAGVLAIGLSACGNRESRSVGNEEVVFYDAVREEITDGNGEFYDVLHGQFDNICESSAVDNAFMSRDISGGAGYTLNGFDLSRERYKELEDSLKVLTASELNEFELLAYAYYLDNTGNAFSSSLSSASQRVLFDYVKSVYEGTTEGMSYRNAVGDAVDAYYESLEVPALENISYEANGNYLQIRDNALMSGLFAFGEGETVVECYETQGSYSEIRYTSEDGGWSSIAVRPKAGIAIGSKGTAIGYEYISFDDSDDFVLRDIYYLVGGGCLNGEISEEERPLSVSAEDTKFFGERTLGSLAEAECYITFEKMVKDLCVAHQSMSYALEQDIGISLVSSVGVYSGELLERLGYAPDDAAIDSSAVGRAPLSDGSDFGDLYGWYGMSVPEAAGRGYCRIEGFAVLHSRDYGFSAENYLRIF